MQVKPLNIREKSDECTVINHQLPPVLSLDHQGFIESGYGSMHVVTEHHRLELVIPTRIDDSLVCEKTNTSVGNNGRILVLKDPSDQRLYLAVFRVRERRVDGPPPLDTVLDFVRTLTGREFLLVRDSARRLTVNSVGLHYVDEKIGPMYLYTYAARAEHKLRFVVTRSLDNPERLVEQLTRHHPATWSNNEHLVWLFNGVSEFKYDTFGRVEVGAYLYEVLVKNDA